MFRQLADFALGIHAVTKPGDDVAHAVRTTVEFDRVRDAEASAHRGVFQLFQLEAAEVKLAS